MDGGTQLPEHRRPTTRYCAEIASALLDVPLGHVLSDIRDREIVVARDLAVWLAREVLAHSFTRIGKAIGRDHSTIIVACRRARERGRSDQRYHALMQRARTILEGKDTITVNIKGPLLVSTGSHGIVSIIDATGHVMTEVYPGQIYELPPVNDKRGPTQAECESVARSLVEAYNHVHGFGAKPASPA